VPEPARTTPPPAKRPRGRPRYDGSSADGSVSDAIVSAATRLFSEHGYASVTMTQIARAAGLRQSSLYYWFSRKEEILQATLAVNRVALSYATEMLAGPGAPQVRLFRLLCYDTLQLCRSPWDFNEIERLAEAQPDDFADFWHDYAQLHGLVVSLIEDGITCGAFRGCDAAQAATAALCLDEGLQKRFRSQGRHRSGRGNPFIQAERTAEEYAVLSARTSLRGLLCRPASVDRISRQAAVLDAAACSANG
jgi:TetR/AcrR family transcriptional regulator